jgi:hypothetical protein
VRKKISNITAKLLAMNQSKGNTFLSVMDNQVKSFLENDPATSCLVRPPKELQPFYSSLEEAKLIRGIQRSAKH